MEEVVVVLVSDFKSDTGASGFMSNKESKEEDLTTADLDLNLSTGSRMSNEEDLTNLVFDDLEAAPKRGLRSHPRGIVSSFNECFSL